MDTHLRHEVGHAAPDYKTLFDFSASDGVLRAAEKCTAQIIHPGTPADPNEKDLEKLQKRAAKYN